MDIIINNKYIPLNSISYLSVSATPFQNESVLDVIKSDMKMYVVNGNIHMNNGDIITIKIGNITIENSEFLLDGLEHKKEELLKQFIDDIYKNKINYIR